MSRSNPKYSRRPTPLSDQSTCNSTSSCRFFARKGRCRYGDRCKFSHDERRSSSVGETAAPRVNDVAGNLKRRRTHGEDASTRRGASAAAIDTPSSGSSISSASTRRIASAAAIATPPSTSGGGGGGGGGGGISSPTPGGGGTSSGIFSSKPFSSLDVSATTKRAISRMGFDKMTNIQALSIPPALEGIDIMIRAKTGHGKTLAFGIPMMEHLHHGSPKSQGLVIAPTRELALQIKKVFDILCNEHRFHMMCVIGGTKYDRVVRQLRERRPRVLVATPGRLLALLQDISGLMDQLVFMCLDEADRLLDEGFQRDMESIFRLLPTDGRRNFLASATLPMNLDRYKHMCLTPGYKVVSAMSEESNHQVNTQLVESYVRVTLDDWLVVLWALLDRYVREGKKIIVFFQAAQATRLMAFVLRCSGAFSTNKVFEIHSRLAQNRRVAELNKFKAAPRGGGAILCSSDVGARGWDIDDVDVVIQVGMPSDNDTYVHRVGRTARAGHEGEAVLMLYEWEVRYFTRVFPRIRKLEQPLPPLVARHYDSARAMVEAARKREGYQRVSSQGYQGLLGFYNSYRRKLQMKDVQLVAMMNAWIATLGRNPPPTLKKRTVGKMQLKGVAGLLVE